ncbi:GCN5 family acetyltransferase [Novimethylophilus kurashikiensis]|uniref:GCN5 family acetyltransferase n=1 Tax=Novimethylophilus kurashikiensis TaxID=1825523 RepID=A0A2R5FF60_9PROT|nr:GNAT family N-acetyltransferase [Novimethylophilus kurashikiensis]GBG15061.1 GCN5 family acetyltransferase [Novimethylophilus kurashikiensis]
MTGNKPGAAVPALDFRIAQPADVPNIVSLVNSAYRGDSSRKGWTTEADLLDGQRTDREEINSILADPNSVFFLGESNGELIASAHLQKAGDQAHFGMFAVKPGLQNGGIGKRFMQAAEGFVRSSWQCSSLTMSVITLRLSLIAFYERRGFRRTGEIKPFPQSEKFGIPKVSGLQLEVLEKPLVSGD